MAYQRNGYWYRSRREGGKVVTEYLGNRSWVAPVLWLEEVKRQQHELDRAEAAAAREAERELDRRIDAVGDLARTMTGAVLVVSGYHTHNRQWRKQRDASSD
ncbi:hypothetical protein LLH23_01650 [bacterium]|nr:hypothetical protein [bacterium]